MAYEKVWVKWTWLLFVEHSIAPYFSGASLPPSICGDRPGANIGDENLLRVSTRPSPSQSAISISSRAIAPTAPNAHIPPERI